MGSLFLGLPSELRLRIFSSLSPRERLRILRASKQIKQEVEDDSLWQLYLKKEYQTKKALAELGFESFKEAFLTCIETIQEDCLYLHPLGGALEGKFAAYEELDEIYAQEESNEFKVQKLKNKALESTEHAIFTLATQKFSDAILNHHNGIDYICDIAGGFSDGAVFFLMSEQLLTLTLLRYPSWIVNGAYGVNYPYGLSKVVDVAKRFPDGAVCLLKDEKILTLILNLPHGLNLIGEVALCCLPAAVCFLENQTLIDVFSKNSQGEDWIQTIKNAANSSEHIYNMSRSQPF